MIPLQTVDAATEQSWNEAALASPVDRPQARAWTYRTPAVVLGRSQRQLAIARDGPLPVIDRGAGGGAVLVGPWLLGLSVVLPPTDPRIAGTSVTQGYRWLGEAFVTMLAGRGIIAQSVPPASTRPAPAALAWACFAGVAPWEVVVDGRKLVGFAQRRSRHGVLLVAGALIAAVPWERLCRALDRPAADAVALTRSTVDVAALIGSPPDIGEFVRDLSAAFSSFSTTTLASLSREGSPT